MISEPVKIIEKQKLKVVAAALFGLAIIYQLFCAFRSAPFLLQNALLLDDAFYYFQVARNAAHLGWVTFDGIHRTSGIQLVWGIFLSLLARVFHDRMDFLHAILAVCAVLNTVSGFLFYRLGRALHSSHVGAIALMIWSAMLVRLTPTLMGMEYSLHMVVILCTAILWWKIFNHPADASRNLLVSLGFLVTLNFWTRLDSALYSLIIVLSVSIALRHTSESHRGYWSRIAPLYVIPALGTIGYGAVCYALSGTAVPISGLVKRYYAAHHFDHLRFILSIREHVRWFFEIVSRAILQNIVPFQLAGAEYGVRHFVLLGFMLALVVVGGITLYRGRAENPRVIRLLRFLCILQVAGLIHVLSIVVTIGHFSWITQHYYAWLFVAWCLCSAIAAVHLFSLLNGARLRSIIGAFAICVFVILNSYTIYYREFLPRRPNLNNRRLIASAWINSHLPENARIGAWNAGVLGYFVERTVVNLDGLVNDRGYLEFLKSGKPVEQYLRKERIEYICDVDVLDMSMPYSQTWDHTAKFRNALSWEKMQVVYKDESTAAVVVLKRTD